MKKMDGEGVIKTEIIINLFIVFYFEPWLVFELKVPEMQLTMLNV